VHVLASLINSAEAEATAPNPISPATAEIFWTVIAFAATLVILALTFKKVAGPMDARADAIRADRRAADEARAEVVRLEAEEQARLSAARAEAGRILDAVRAEAEADRAAKLVPINAEIAERRAAIANDVSRAKSEALASMTDQVRSITVSTAGKVVGRSVDSSASSGAVDAYLVEEGVAR
jgi:F-type H+-transporting ATPase subunit b